MEERKVVLTGDRPTGPLHLGHYVGSLANRIKLQNTHRQLIMIADLQALTDHVDQPQMIRESVMEVTLDYLAVGIDPKKTTIFIQSQIPQLNELTLYYLNLVTWNRLKHNPTVKAEIRQKKMAESIPAGFMVYPISQTADITAFKAHLVPVGDDQLPMVEQAVEIVKKFNRIYDCAVLVEPEAMLSEIARLPGTDGKAKMSKTLNNAIYLSDPSDIVAKKIRGMYTDPHHLHVEDPGKVEGNPVFIYLDAFGKNRDKLQEMKEHYRRGGLGDVVVKKYLLSELEEFLEPIRKKRREYAKDRGYLQDMLKEGANIAREIAEQTLKEVREVLYLNY